MKQDNKFHLSPAVFIPLLLTEFQEEKCEGVEVAIGLTAFPKCGSIKTHGKFSLNANTLDNRHIKRPKNQVIRLSVLKTDKNGKDRSLKPNFCSRSGWRGCGFGFTGISGHH